MKAEATPEHDKASRLMKAERWQEAHEILVQVCAESPEVYSVHWDCGWCLVKLGKPLEAVPPLARATELEPSRAEAHWALGLAQAQAGLREQAQRSLLRSLALKDTYVARLALARLYQEAGRPSEAENVYREGIRLQPTHRERVEALADFLSDTGRKAEAVALYERALAMDPREQRRK